jgi:hypothetical protein
LTPRGRGDVERGILIRAGQLSEQFQRSAEVDLLLVLRMGPSIPIAVACMDEGLERGQRLERLVCGRAGERQAGSKVDSLALRASVAGGDELARSRIEAHNNDQVAFSVI